ncbi:MAG: methylmalonyl-CoA mutase family protein [Cytophagales bacterium]|nr:methylmalonyl-CoA mutase family protein [Bernardetiaceae bacterium]MDW8205950.1 methylmalonyl-CoA mutase family protein [Cytophagales bacterium]
MNLFSEFPVLPFSAWEAQAQKELKGADLVSKLHWQTPDGFEIGAFFADLPAPAWEQYLTNSIIAATEALGRSWRNRLLIEWQEERAANAQALDMLNRNVNEIAFDVTGKAKKVQLEVLLQEIMLPFCAVSWQLNANEATDFVQRYLAYASDKGYALGSLSGRIDLHDASGDVRLALSEMVQGTSLHTIVINTAGETISKRWAKALVEAYRLLQIAPQAGLLLPHVAVCHTLGNSYFAEIAGMRAFRLLFAEMATEFVSTYSPANLHIAACTGFEGNPQDPYWNMISNTTQAMAAIVGGCNTLEVTPHQKGFEPVDSFGQRIAINVSNILAEEAYFGKQIDPAAGSYYIEQLTEKMLEAIWNNFQQYMQRV